MESAQVGGRAGLEEKRSEVSCPGLQLVHPPRAVGASRLGREVLDQCPEHTYRLACVPEIPVLES